MEATPKIIGSSLEVLAPYLPYGIEVELQRPRIYRARLVALGQPRGWNTLYLDRHDPALPILDCLPVLRPLHQLVRPDNKAPLELFELLEAITGSAIERITLAVFAKIDDDTEPKLRVQFHASGSKYPTLLHMEPTGAALVGGELKSCVDWLRSKHFALPANGRPLVEGVDFIAKAGLPAIQEGSQPQAT